MENQSGQPQYTMVDQGFRPFSALMSVPSTAQQHAGSSSSTAVVQVAAALQSHTDHGNICLADDGYYWRMIGQNTSQGGSSPTILSHYQCAQANCVVHKTVAHTADVETFYRGSHNHPRQSDRLEPMSQPSTARNGDDQSSGSSDRDEDGDGDVEMDGDAAAGDPNEMQRRKPKSKVWKEFKRVYKDGKLHTAICNHCKNRFVAETIKGTSHLSRHLKSCPAKAGTSRVQKKKRSSTSQPDLPVSENLVNGQENPLEGFMRAIVLRPFPFSAMYIASIAPFLAGRNPAPYMVRQTTDEEKFHSVYENEKLKLKEKIIATPGGVFLSLEVWHSIRCVSARTVCLTVHFIDEDWKINRKTIRCSLSEYGQTLSLYPHWESKVADTKDHDKMVLKEVVRDWCLEQKLLGVTLKKSVDKTATASLEDDLTTGRNYLVAKCKLLTIPCMVDALNDLVVYYTVWTNQSVWSRYMTSSPERKLKYQEVLSQLPLDCPSPGSKPWYLRYYLFEAALQFVKSFPLPGATADDESDLSDSSDPGDPSFDDLEAAENFCKILRPVYHAIKTVSDPYNVTFNSYFHVIWSLRATLQELPSIKNVLRVEDMQRTFEKHWNKWYLWLSIAVVLDPRYKFDYIEHCFRQTFGHDARMYISEVRAKFYEVYIQYFYVSEQRDEMLNHRNNGSDTQIRAPLHNQSQNNTAAQTVVEEFKELREYLGGGLCSRNDSFDVLKWWRGNSFAYPTLAKMARDILAIPGYAVSAESAFDEQDQRAVLFDVKLRPETTEALICAQSWIK